MSVNRFVMFWHPHYIYYLLHIVPFPGGWLADRMFGDPKGLPHLVVAFGKLISMGERRLNNGKGRYLKGAILALCLTAGTCCMAYALLRFACSIHPCIYVLLAGIGVFYCLAGNTLIKEVRFVFDAVERNIDEGRERLSGIVGRDTSRLSPQEVRTAALETLAENLSDGVIAPMFWFMFFGLPGMMAYKMVNTLDSMIGYRNERYVNFGKMAARLDDMANYIPARLTACMMLLVSGNWDKRGFLHKYGKAHSSPNSGYPEAALAGILNCRFGGPHDYSGETVDKPYIGTNNRELTIEDMKAAVRINNNTELLMGLIVTAIIILFTLWLK